MSLKNIKERWRTYQSLSMSKKYALDRESDFLLAQAIEDIFAMIHVLELVPQGCICHGEVLYGHTKECMEFQNAMKILEQLD